MISATQPRPTSRPALEPLRFCAVASTGFVVAFGAPFFFAFVGRTSPSTKTSAGRLKLESSAAIGIASKHSLLSNVLDLNGVHIDVVSVPLLAIPLVIRDRLRDVESVGACSIDQLKGLQGKKNQAYLASNRCPGRRWSNGSSAGRHRWREDLRLALAHPCHPCL